MAELRAVAARVRPHEVLLVLDAMAGQEAVAVAQGFQEAVGVDGVVLTRLDSDARGGAALSVRWATGRPIKFVSTGERLDAIEPFHPDRMASRILGMGDVLTLIEKAEQALAREQAEAMQRRIETHGLTLEDFLEQMQAIRRMGPLGELLGMLPGLRGGLPQVDERELVRATAIIQSMTPRERRHPEILDASRRRRIARGSGTSVQDVNRLLRQFEEVRRLWKGLARGRLPGVPWGGRARGGRPPRERGPRQGR
jgi:signal recognition particle subunit SRP54